MPIKYNFDEEIDRRDTGSSKWDQAETLYKVKGILPMWVADMDFRLPHEVGDAIKQAVESGIFGYSYVRESYFQALIEWQKKRHRWTIQRDWVVMCTGVVPAIRMAIKAFVQPGEQVIVQTPVYYPFFSVIKDNGCEMLDNPLKLVGGIYHMDLADLKKKISPRTKMMLLCNPHNPVGRVWRLDEIQALGDVCREHNLIVVSDEIHGDIILPGNKHVPFPVAMPDYIEKMVVCTSGSKTFNLAGLKTSSTIIANADMRKAYAAVVRSHGLGSVNTFGPVATEAAWRYAEPWLEQLIDYLQGNFDYLKERAVKIPGLKATPLEGTYLAWLDFRNCAIPQDRLGKFVREDAKVALEPGTQFGAQEEGFERMNIACTRRTLAEAMDRIEKAIGKIKK